MMKYDRLRLLRAPVFKEDIDAVFGCHKCHVTNSSIECTLDAAGSQV